MLTRSVSSNHVSHRTTVSPRDPSRHSARGDSLADHPPSLGYCCVLISSVEFRREPRNNTPQRTYYSVAFRRRRISLVIRRDE
eukprot:5841964-Pyramimonas_sp.AAC.1